MHLQTVDNSSSLPLLSFALPLVNLKDQFKERAFGGGNVPMPRPPQVLELADHEVALLRLEGRVEKVPMRQEKAGNIQRSEAMKSLTRVMLQTLKSLLMTSQSFNEDIHST